MRSKKLYVSYMRTSSVFYVYNIYIFSEYTINSNARRESGAVLDADWKFGVVHC